MNQSASYVYAGNRSGVLRRMLALGLKVNHVLPSSGSWLEREAPEFGLPTTVIGSKAQAIEVIGSLSFGVFVSAGFPYILPISKLRAIQPSALYINMHPSYLPDLKGADPIPGAIIYRRNTGVTCHHMDDGIDTGAIISQTAIEYFDGLDAKLLYNRCFQMEPDVFENALRNNFKSADHIVGDESRNLIYYSLKENDLFYKNEISNINLISNIRACNTRRHGLRFQVEGRLYRVFDAEIINSASWREFYNSSNEDEIVASYEDSILINRQNELIRFGRLEPRPETNLAGFKIRQMK